MSQNNEQIEKAPTTSEGTGKFACPRCGWHDDTNPRAPEDDLREYLRCVLGGNAFTKTYILYGGALRLTFTTLTMDQAELVNMVIMQNKFEDNDELADVARKTKLLFCLKSMKMTGDAVVFGPPAPQPAKLEELEGRPIFDWSKEAMRTQFSERFGKLDETMIRTIYRTFSLFEVLSRLLVSDGFDENFWKGAGPF